MTHLFSDGANGYTLRVAAGGDELDAVYRFRFEHFFRGFAEGYPGLDRKRGLVTEPHDRDSRHYCAFDADGTLCAVSTATPACSPCVPPAWREWFRFDGLAPVGMDRIVVSTRMVLHPDHRHSDLFGLFYRFIMGRYLEEGFDCAVHYCSPGLICRYEHFGHRLYGEPFAIPPGILRAPMLIDLNDPGYLRRLGSPIAELCAARARRVESPEQAFLPEFTAGTNFRLLSPEERLAYVLARTKTARLPAKNEILPSLGYASPLRLKAGLLHAAPAKGGFLCVILDGAVRENGIETPKGPGDFVGEGLLHDFGAPPPPFTVLSGTEVLVFDRDLTLEASRVRRESDNPSPWAALSIACTRTPALSHPTRRQEEIEPCGMRS